MTIATETTRSILEIAPGATGRPDGRRASPARKPLWQIFDEVATQHAGRTAVTFGDRQLTYRELQAQASQLARRLRDLGVGPDSLVGVFLERSAQAIVAAAGRRESRWSLFAARSSLSKRAHSHHPRRCTAKGTADRGASSRPAAFAWRPYDLPRLRDRRRILLRRMPDSSRAQARRIWRMSSTPRDRRESPRA